MGDLTYTANDDGTINVNSDGTVLKYVKESDLLAVKGGSQTKVKEWETEKATFNTQLAEANRLRDEDHNSLLQERTVREQLEDKFKDYETHKARVGELETELNSHKEVVGKHEIELADRIRQTLIAVHGAHEDALKDKNLDQLRHLEEAAKVFGSNTGRLPRYDGGGGGPSGGGVPESSLDRARRILEEHEAKGHKIGAK